MADLQTATRLGGWALQVVYRDPAAPLRMVATTDQVATVNNGGTASLVLAASRPAAAVTNPIMGWGLRIVPEQVASTASCLKANAVDDPLNAPSDARATRPS